MKHRISALEMLGLAKTMKALAEEYRARAAAADDKATANCFSAAGHIIDTYSRAGNRTIAETRLRNMASKLDNDAHKQIFESAADELAKTRFVNKTHSKKAIQ